MTEHNYMIHDIEVEVHHEIIITTKKNNSENRYRSTSRDRFSFDKSTTLP